MGEFGKEPTVPRKVRKYSRADLIKPGSVDRALAEARARRAQVLAERGGPVAETLPKPWHDDGTAEVRLIDEDRISVSTTDTAPPEPVAHPEPTEGRLTLELTEAQKEEVTEQFSDADEETEAAPALPLLVLDDTDRRTDDASVSPKRKSWLPWIPFRTSNAEADDDGYWKTPEERKRRRSRRAGGISAIAVFAIVYGGGTLVLPGEDTIGTPGEIVLLRATHEPVVIAAEHVSRPSREERTVAQASASQEIPVYIPQGLLTAYGVSFSDSDLLITSEYPSPLSNLALRSPPALGSPIAPDTYVSPVRIVLHAPTGLEKEPVDELVAAVNDAGYEVARLGRAGFTILENHVRFYHPNDAGEAQRLAGLIDGDSRDFTNFHPKPDAGVVEVWLAGDAGDQAVVPSPETIDERQLDRDELIAEMISAVLAEQP